MFQGLIGAQSLNLLDFDDKTKTADFKSFGV